MMWNHVPALIGNGGNRKKEKMKDESGRKLALDFFFLFLCWKIGNGEKVSLCL